MPSSCFSVGSCGLLVRMLTASDSLTSTVPGLFIRLDLQTVQQLIEAAEEIDHRHHFDDPLVVQSQLPHRGSMDVDSILAPHDR